jgi:hypothetical protein
VKTCFKCREAKPRSEFYKHSAMGDGFLSKCKECTRVDVRANRAANIDRYREYDRVRALRPERIARTVEVTRRWRQKHPGRQNAHNIAFRGHRQPPSACERCDQPKRLERHHPDYGQPLLIQWLCKPCHYLADQERRACEVAR